jgi:hypothetical protein
LFFVFVLCLVYPILPVFRYCPFCDCPFGAFRGVFLLCLRSVSCVLNVRSISGFSIFWLPLRCSLAFIFKEILDEIIILFAI